MEIGTAGAFGGVAIAVDVGEVTVVGAMGADTDPGDARAAEPDFCCPVASAAALFFSRACSKSTSRKFSP
jgi:hypothetical protein